MKNEKLDGLLAYLDRLTALEIAGFRCSREITECILALRKLQELLPIGFTVKDGEELTIKIGYGDTADYYLARGPAVITLERDKE